MLNSVLDSIALFFLPMLLVLLAMRALMVSSTGAFGSMWAAEVHPSMSEDYIRLDANGVANQFLLFVSTPSQYYFNVYAIWPDVEIDDVAKLFSISFRKRLLWRHSFLKLMYSLAACFLSIELFAFQWMELCIQSNDYEPIEHVKRGPMSEDGDCNSDDRSSSDSESSIGFFSGDSDDEKPIVDATSTRLANLFA